MATAGGARGPGPERAFARPLPAAGPVRLDAEESHHLVRVRRAREGDPVVLFDGKGETRLARLAVADPKGASLEIEGPYPDREPSRRVTVLCALPAAGRADDLVSALAEMGVSRLVPLICARSGPDAAEAAGRRRERFERIAREAAKVNGRSRILDVGPALAPLPALAEWRTGGRDVTAVLLDTDPSLPDLAARVDDAVSCALFVGPEGGFTDAEVASLKEADVVAASLGACALRTETAAFAAAAIALGVGTGRGRVSRPPL